VTAGLSARSWAKHAIEDLTSLGEVVVFGDDVDPVFLAAAGGRDVKPSMRGGCRCEGDADIDRVALMSVLGGGVPEPDMLGDVLPPGE
jgi:hypothetical protein